MAVKQMRTMKPVRFIIDKKGNKIPIYRAGSRDTNRYAKKSPSEKRNEANIGNRNYDPNNPSTFRKKR